MKFRPSKDTYRTTSVSFVFGLTKSGEGLLDLRDESMIGYHKQH
jgi:hypothetical protein